MQDNIIAFPEPPPSDTVEAKPTYSKLRSEASATLNCTCLLPSQSDQAQFVTHAFPVCLTSLIGREHELQALHALLLRPDVRLLTLTGTAGVGKTRLALEVARDLVHDFADGVHVVSLAPISDPAFVIATIAHSIGLPESGSQPLLELLNTPH